MVVLQVVLRSVLFGLVGGFATLLLLVCVNFFVWGAFWRPLRNTGWIWLHDVGATYILAFAPMVAAAAFSVLSALVEVIERIRSKPSPLVELVLLVVFPSATALAEMLRLHPRVMWQFPGTEMSVALAGWLVLRLRRKLVHRRPAMQA